MWAARYRALRPRWFAGYRVGFDYRRHNAEAPLTLIVTLGVTNPKRRFSDGHSATPPCWARPSGYPHSADAPADTYINPSSLESG